MQVFQPLVFYSSLQQCDVPMPLLESFVSAGFPSPANDYLESGLDVRQLLIRNPSSTFFARVSGNSMIDAGIHDGDVLVIDKSLNPHDDSILVCCVDGEFTVKKVQKIDNDFYLVPQNKNLSPIKINESADFRLWGVVTFVIHKIQ